MELQEEPDDLVFPNVAFFLNRAELLITKEFYSYACDETTLTKYPSQHRSFETHSVQYVLEKVAFKYIQ